MGHLTALGARTRWPGLRGRILQNKIRETYVRKTRHILPRFDKPPDDGGVPLLQRHERNIRFQLAAVDEYKAPIVEHGIKLGSRNEAVTVPNTLADICGREVTVFHFRRRSHPGRGLLRRQRMQQRLDTLQRCKVFDVTRDERTPLDVLDHISAGNALHGLDAKSSFMERYL